MRFRALAFVLFAASSAPLLAQDPAGPPAWVVRSDESVPGAETAIELTAMPPGWHLTATPAAILYDPVVVGRGAFRIEAELHRFPGGLESGFGLFFGGSDLTGVPDYFAFLIDGTGRFELYHRAGEEVHSVTARATHPAVLPWTEGSVKNVLAAEVRSDSVRFIVNGQEVAAFQRQPYMDFEGVVGLRVEGNVDLHLSRLDVTPLPTSEGG